MTGATSSDEAPPTTRNSTTRTRGLAVLGAVLAALAVWVIAVPLLGVDLRVSMSPGGSDVQTVSTPFVVAASLLVSLLGWALLALLERRTARAATIWTVVAAVVLLLSLGSPLSSGTTAATKVTLALMHIAVAAVLIPTLRSTTRSRG